MMDFKQLQAFVTLAEQLHFARTAEQLHMTASALTRLMQRLEDELDVQLLLRNNRLVELTPAGQKFLVYAASAVERNHRIRRELADEAADIAGRLKLYSSVTASYGLLSPLLKEFRQNFPKVEVNIHTGDQAQALERIQSGQEDLAIAALPERLPDALLFKTLMFSSLCFIMPAEGALADTLAEQLAAYAKEPTAENFAKLPVVISERGLARERLSNWFNERNVRPNIYAEVSGHEAIVSMVALGVGIGVVPEIVIQHSPLQGKIKLLDAAPELQAFQIGLCVLKKRLELPAVKAFWQAAKTQH